MRLPKIIISIAAKETILKRLTILGLILLITAATILSAITVKVIKTGSAFISAKPQNTIIVDAGHGGFDGGAVVSNINEKDINLKIANKVSFLLKLAGFNVIETRTDDSSTESDSSASISAKKKSDLQNRLELAKQNPDAIFVSIHLNKYPSSAPNGAQMFYSPNNKKAELLAECMRQSIVSLLQNDNKRQIKKGDKNTYLLYYSPIPTVIAECGFMSNDAEFKRLLDDTYQTKMAFSIFNGILKYFSQSS